MARFQSVTAQKGDIVNLNKVTENDSTPLSKLHVGLGWDVHNDVDVDLDAFVVQLDKEGRLIDTIFFNHLKSKDGAIVHTGDNLTGEGEGDDEVINIDLNRLNTNTHRLVVAVNIYQCRLSFNDIKNAFVRILDRKSGDLIVRYDLSYEFGNNYSMIVGEIVKTDDGTWDFKAIGKPTPDRSVNEVRLNLVNSNASKKQSSNEPPTTGSQPRKQGWFSRLFN